MAKGFSIFAIPDNLPDQERKYRRSMLARLGLSWLMMMQIMMFAIPGYIKDRYIDTDSYDFLIKSIVMMNWISLALTIPLIFYCATPVWNGLFNTSLHGKSSINMNWPVALGIVVSFIPSVVATITHIGEVYFDSISMFVAFLLTARYLELSAKQATQDVAGNDALILLQKEMSAKADKVAFFFVILQIVLAIISAFIWYFLVDKNHAIPVLVSLFVMSCPCAMAMAVPTAFSAAKAAISSQQVQKTTYAYIKKIINQNLYGSLIWHVLMTPLAMFGLVEPWLAAITMFISSMAVAINSIRLYKSLKTYN